MPTQIKLGIIGDFNPVNQTHLATDQAIEHAAEVLQVNAAIEWVPTPQIVNAGTGILHSFDALWCSPGSPYASMEGALDAIRFAREANIPFFGT
jgi:CTP synthase (UTP-ammonia lyase)